MIPIPPSITALLAGNTSSRLFIVSMGAHNLTSHSRDMVVNGVTYLGNGALQSIEPRQMSSVVDRQLFKFSLLDVGIPWGVSAENGMVGLAVKAYMGVLNPVTGRPFSNLTDYLELYTGVVDSVGYKIQTSEQGSKIFVVTCASPMNDLDMKRPVYTSQDFMNKNHPGDTSYEQVFEGSGPIEVKWGKE